MNRQDRIRTGNWDIFRVLTATQVGYPDSEEHLTQILRSFNYRDILIILARINLLLQRRDPSETEEILRKNFCAPVLLNAINLSRELKGNIIFNRESTLHLLHKSASISDPRSNRVPDATANAMYELAKCYLIANELIGTHTPDFGRNLTEEQRKELLAALIPASEYAINPSPWPHIKNTLVRSKEFLARLQDAALTFDLSETFSQATGLTLQEYQYLIFSILSVSSNFSPEEILEGKVLFVDTKPSPALTLLYDKLLQHACISIDELAAQAKAIPSLSNEFRLWRKYPLVKIDENHIMCIDIGFLLEKLETGVFWIIRDKLEKAKTGKGEEIIGLRGQVFEDYAASIIRRVINAQTPSNMEGYIIGPKYDRNRGECTDIAVCGDDALILLECKAPLLSAKTKFSGDFRKFYNELKDKIIEGKDTKRRKGIKQLWNAIQTLGHTNKKKRGKVEGIDISKVKKIYPVLILSDRVFSFPLMNRFLDSEFQRFVKHSNLKKHLEIMPLTVLTIADLESLEPYLSDTPLHVHLYQWMTQIFLDNKSYPFSQYLRLLRKREVRQNRYMEQEIKRMHADMEECFSSWGIVD